MSRPGVEFTRTVRAQMVAREQEMCFVCGRFAALDAHHRVLRSQGGMGLVENGVMLCGSGTTGCHGWVHGHVKEARRFGLIVPSWAAPAEVEVKGWRGWGLFTPGGLFVPRTPEPDIPRGWEVPASAA